MNDLCTNRDIPDDVAIPWLEKHSDMTSAELVAARGKDDKVILDLIAFESQVQTTMQLPEQCAVTPVLFRVLDLCAARAGRRLQRFKTNAGLKDDGKVDFNKLSYRTMLTTNGELVVQHVMTGHEKTIADSGVTVAHRLIDNCLDHQAAFVKHPMPPIKLALFFQETKNGPFTVPALTANGKVFKEIVVASVASWEEARKLASTAGGGLTADTKMQLDQQQHDLCADRASNTREAAAKSSIGSTAFEEDCFSSK